jgi:hypothetical protein
MSQPSNSSSGAGVVGGVMQWSRQALSVMIPSQELVTEDDIGKLNDPFFLQLCFRKVCAVMRGGSGAKPHTVLVGSPDHTYLCNILTLYISNHIAQSNIRRFGTLYDLGCLRSTEPYKDLAQTGGEFESNRFI